MLFITRSIKAHTITCESGSQRSRTLVFSSLLIAIAILHNAQAEPDAQSVSAAPELCPNVNQAAIVHIRPRPFAAENIDNTEISADATRTSADGSTSLDGNVIIEKHLLRISTDHAHYDKKDDLLTISGNVNINTESLSLSAESGTVSMTTQDGSAKKTGEFNDIKFIIPDTNMKGTADSIIANDHTDADGGIRSTLTNASITSCSLLDPDWLLSADEIRLDHDDEYGEADDVVIRFKDIPFMYTPYIEFPTSNKRRSGLLFPSFGTSTSRGIELTLPWYWNIAPNQDAVLEPRYMEKRGMELGGNYRYLTRSTRGELTGNYLPDDNITQEDRYQVRYQQHSRIISNLMFDADLQDISDANYFNDFANDIGTTSQTHLNRSATLTYNLDNWQLKAMVQNIKTIDDTTPLDERPYQRLPQITFNGDSAIARSPVIFTLDTEYVDFNHEDETKITGGRTTIRPGLRLPIHGTSWFIEPAVKFHHTQYDTGTEGNDEQPGTSQEIRNLNLPVSSIDAGLVFERYLDGGNRQTLEPRLYYLHVPYEDQSSTPLFDTSIPNFGVTQLFRDNRFTGGDRFGDANQLTLALTSRTLKTATGDELFRASIGQIYYFKDRRVSLDDTIDRSKQSDIIAELDTYLGDWQGNVDLQWDSTREEISKENYFVHYKSDNRHLFNIGYRKLLDDGNIDIEQADTSFVLAFNREYSGIARWNYSLKDDKDIDIIAGINYDSCCWSIQLLGQRRLKNTPVTTSGTGEDDAYDNAILVQFVFKGLGSLSGNKARSTLENSIYGYTNPFQ